MDLFGCSYQGGCGSISAHSLVISNELVQVTLLNYGGYSGLVVPMSRFDF